MSPTFQEETRAPGDAGRDLIRQTALALGQFQVPTSRDCVGLRARAERLTDLLIDAMFPRHAEARDTDATERLDAQQKVLQKLLGNRLYADEETTLEATVGKLLKSAVITEKQAVHILLIKW